MGKPELPSEMDKLGHQFEWAMRAQMEKDLSRIPLMGLVVREIHVWQYIMTWAKECEVLMTIDRTYSEYSQPISEVVISTPEVNEVEDETRCLQELAKKYINPDDARATLDYRNAFVAGVKV